MIKKNISLFLVVIFLIATLSGCSSKSSTIKMGKDSPKKEENGTQVQVASEDVNEVYNKEEKTKDNEEKGKKIAIEEIEKYFEIEIDDSYELKFNYYDYGDDSKYYQYLFWNSSNTFDVRIGENEEKAFYLQQILPENNDGKVLNKDEAEKMSMNFIKEKMKDLSGNLVLTNVDYEVEKNSTNVQYYVFQYNEKDNSDKGVFIKVDCYNKYVNEITIFD